jgi:ATP-dependent DNA helicase RecG
MPKKSTSPPAAAEPGAVPARGAEVKSPAQKALEKLGLVRDIDLALHLPLRYEDETRITKLDEARDGDHVQIEATVTACEVSFRPRKQLVVTVNDGTETCTLRFFSFYPSQQKALAVGNRIRARGEIKGGFLGRTMLHPAFRAAGGDLPTVLTPIYPTMAGLPQPYLRKAVLAGLARADLSDTFAPGDLEVLNHGIEHQPLWTLRDALHFLHHPRPDV